MTESPTVEDYRFMRFLNKLVWASIPVLFTLGGWVGAQVIDHEGRIKLIESTRYSRETGVEEREARIKGDVEMRALILDTLHKIEKRLDALERR